MGEGVGGMDGSKVREPRKDAMAAMRPQKCEEIGIKEKRESK
jgi:hypothetical protein